VAATVLIVVLLPGTDGQAARRVLDRVGTGIRVVLEPYGAGLSMGATEMVTGDTVQDMLQRADHHLYEVKARRRNPRSSGCRSPHDDYHVRIY
jgi:PleD family two-component response regulator